MRLQTHGGTKPSVDLENSQLIEEAVILSGCQGGIRNDLIFLGGTDFVPFAESGTRRSTSGQSLIAQINCRELTHSPLD